MKDDAVQIKLKQITPYQDNVNLSGLINEDVIRFSLRKDQIVTNANLHLEYIPSPALLPTVSQLIVYLNNDIIATYPITQEQVGNKVVNNIPIDPNLVTTKNEIKFQFIGHYTDICENPIHSSLWLKILRNSTLQLNTAQIPVKNELSFLPFPFIDENDNQPSYIPIVFHGAPNPMQQQASAVLASWFATKSQWRGFQFDVTYNQLPKENAIVFITNQNKPDFLKNYAPVQQPTVELIDNPSYPNTKLLVLAGRNDQDLLLLAKALATSNIQLNGSKVLVNKLNELGKRQPYDAPNWLPIDQALTLGQIKTYSNQLTTAGYKLDPLRLSITLPPDLFALSKYSTSLNLKYRYTRPINPDDSKMLVYLNNQFLKTIRLGDSKDDNKLTLQIPVHQGLASDDAAFKIPGLLPEKTNELRFEPYFMSPVPGGTTTQCVTYQPVPNAVTIDDNSVIDFSKFAHYMAMPNLRVFINAGYPYSRMADLSETIIITPSNPTAQQMSLLLNTVGLISNKTGLPAYNLRVADKNTDLNKEDKDILLFADYHQDGNFAKLKIDNLHIQNGKNELTAPIDYSLGDKISRNDSAKVATQMTAQGNIGAIVGVESPYFKKRSVIAILANNNSSIELLNNVMINPNKFDISGGVSVIRESGVTNIDMGEQYHVGDLSAFEILQIKISKHPILAALIALLVLIIISFILAKRMKKIRHNRINND
ncbi:hypothetical protein BJI46_12655 [Acinetobacter qingfengensis]|uniref:Cyclic di-GMP-binding protein n=1 Tax=Acinetobacter qingfengensis TaxID=1262585 RepID=A0A1E7R942_9GAMM|nr:hypothetical protein BJI46_12655 [Acinetobacter qingfengensis]